jgi:hypothetical protein
LKCKAQLKEHPQSYYVLMPSLLNLGIRKGSLNKLGDQINISDFSIINIENVIEKDLTTAPKELGSVATKLGFSSSC